MDHFDSPIDESLRYSRTQIGFGLMALACAMMTIDAVGWAGILFIPDFPLRTLLLTPTWPWFAGTILTWSAFLGSFALLGRWDHPFWKRHCTILMASTSACLILWFLRHADRFGWIRGEAAYAPLRMHLTLGLRWIWMFALVDLATEVSEHLGSPLARKERASARTALGVACLFWGFLVLVELPFLFNPRLGRGFLIGMRGPRLPFIGFILARCVAGFLSTIAALIAARQCSQIVKELRAQNASDSSYRDSD